MSHQKFIEKLAAGNIKEKEYKDTVRSYAELLGSFVINSYLKADLSYEKMRDKDHVIEIRKQLSEPFELIAVRVFVDVLGQKPLMNLDLINGIDIEALETIKPVDDLDKFLKEVQEKLNVMSGSDQEEIERLEKIKQTILSIKNIAPEVIYGAARVFSFWFRVAIEAGANRKNLQVENAIISALESSKILRLFEASYQDNFNNKHKEKPGNKLLPEAIKKPYLDVLKQGNLRYNIKLVNQSKVLPPSQLFSRNILFFQENDLIVQMYEVIQKFDLARRASIYEEKDFKNLEVESFRKDIFSNMELIDKEVTSLGDIDDNPKFNELIFKISSVLYELAKFKKKAIKEPGNSFVKLLDTSQFMSDSVISEDSLKYVIKYEKDCINKKINALSSAIAGNDLINDRKNELKSYLKSFFDSEVFTLIYEKEQYLGSMKIRGFPINIVQSYNKTLSSEQNAENIVDSYVNVLNSSFQIIEKTLSTTSSYKQKTFNDNWSDSGSDSDRSITATLSIVSEGEMSFSNSKERETATSKMLDGIEKRRLGIIKKEESKQEEILPPSTPGLGKMPDFFSHKSNFSLEEELQLSSMSPIKSSGGFSILNKRFSDHFSSLSPQKSLNDNVLPSDSSKKGTKVGKSMSVSAYKINNNKDEIGDLVNVTDHQSDPNHPLAFRKKASGSKLSKAKKEEKKEEKKEKKERSTKMETVDVSCSDQGLPGGKKPKCKSPPASFLKEDTKHQEEKVLISNNSNQLD
ncbi:hypothetical protein L3V79_02445 [Thiotrichales bacterium 19S9-12]|nr:hypothetical protein [Thiotrichales bacterium 19S9-12]